MSISAHLVRRLSEGKTTGGGLVELLVVLVLLVGLPLAEASWERIATAVR